MEPRFSALSVLSVLYSRTPIQALIFDFAADLPILQLLTPELLFSTPASAPLGYG